MVIKIRCCECRRVVRAAPQAGDRQKVCCAECRAKRKRKQAKRRRQQDIIAAREDELRRQHRHRDKARAQRDASAAAEPGAEAECHAPAESHNLPNLQQEASNIVDLVWRVSRPRLERELARQLRENKASSQQATPEMWQRGAGCHAPGEVRSEAKNGSESSDSVDRCHAPG